MTKYYINDPTEWTNILRNIKTPQNGIPRQADISVESSTRVLIQPTLTNLVLSSSLVNENEEDFDSITFVQGSVNLLTFEQDRITVYKDYKELNTSPQGADLSSLEGYGQPNRLLSTGGGGDPLFAEIDIPPMLEDINGFGSSKPFLVEDGSGGVKWDDRVDFAGGFLKLDNRLALDIAYFSTKTNITCSSSSLNFLAENAAAQSTIKVEKDFVLLKSFYDYYGNYLSNSIEVGHAGIIVIGEESQFNSENIGFFNKTPVTQRSLNLSDSDTDLLQDIANGLLDLGLFKDIA